MPELVTHTLAGWLLVMALRARAPKLDPLVVLVGCCLPDWVSHGWVLWPPSFEYLALLHEPLPLLLICVLVGSFAAPGRRLRLGANLYLGAALHYAMDFFQIHAFPVSHPLFPLSSWSTGIGLYAVEGSIYVAPAFIILALIFLYRTWPPRG